MEILSSNLQKYSLEKNTGLNGIQTQSSVIPMQCSGSWSRCELVINPNMTMRRIEMKKTFQCNSCQVKEVCNGVLRGVGSDPLN